MKEEKIEEHWSPEQIANRVTEKNEKVPSTATIYRMIHSDKIETLKKVRMNQLRQKGVSTKNLNVCKESFDDRKKIKKSKNSNRRKELWS